MNKIQKGVRWMKKRILITIWMVMAAMCVYASETKKVRVAFFPNITHSQALHGQVDGKYQLAVGVPIEWKEFNAGSAEIESFMAGEVDIGFIGPGPAVNGYIRTRGEIQIIAGAAFGGAQLIVRKDLKINDIKDLSGKKIAVPQYGNTQDMVLRGLLNKAGLKDANKGGTVVIVQAENPDIKTLIDQGKIDAAIVPEPWATRILKETQSTVFLNNKDLWKQGEYNSAVVIVRKEFADKNKELVAKFLKAHIEETQYINQNKEKAKLAINSKLKEITGKSLSEDVINTAFGNVQVTDKLSRESIVEFAELSKQSGYLRNIPDLKGLFR